MGSVEIPELVLTKIFKKHGQEDQLRARKELDNAFRAIFYQTAAEGVAGTQFQGQWQNGIDPEKTRLIIESLIDEACLRKDYNPALGELTELRQLEIEHARKCYGVDKAGIDEDKYQDIVGYLPYPEWEMTGHGKYIEGKTGQRISWVPGDPLVLERIRNTTATWFKDFVMGSVDPHLSATKKAGIEPNEVIRIVLMADLAEREGIDLQAFIQRVNRAGKGGPAIREVAAQMCDERDSQMRPVLRTTLIDTLARLVPVLTAEGKLNELAVMEKMKARPWGEKGEWDQLIENEPDLFKHLECKGKVFSLMYAIAYESFFRSVTRNLQAVEHIPGQIDQLVDGKKFLFYRTTEVMGLDFTANLTQSIAAFLAKNPEWKGYGENLMSYLQTKGSVGGQKFLVGLPDEIRKAILMNLGIDIRMGIPDKGYTSWRRSLDNLIANAKRLGYDPEEIAALNSFNGVWNEDFRKQQLPKDVVLAFKWRLAEAAYERYKADAGAYLEAGMNVDQIWEALKIDQGELLSRDATAEAFTGMWGGDRLGEKLDRELRPSIFKQLYEQPGVVLTRWMIGAFDFLHGKPFKPSPEMGILGKLLPDGAPVAMGLINNLAISIILNRLSGAIDPQVAFRTFPIIDRFFPAWLKTFTVFPVTENFLGFAIFLGLSSFFPNQLWFLSPLKIWGKGYSYGLEIIDDILRWGGWGRILSPGERKEARKSDKQGKQG
jgi:hypothetical protein